MSTEAPRMLKQFCSVCKDHLEMPVVEEDKDQDVVWLKCPGCNGFLPYLETVTEEAEDVLEGSASAEIVRLEDLDVDSAIEYDFNRVYNVGDTIFHRSWNDYGRVISKETLPGNRAVIVVQFIMQGEIKLRENTAA